MAALGEVLRGLTIISDNKPDGITWNVDAQHDELFVQGPPPEDLNPIALAMLEKDGWGWVKEHNCWKKFT